MTVPGQRVPLLAIWDKWVPPVLIPRLVEAAILTEEIHGYGSFFDSIPPGYDDNACRHALSILRRLEQGPRRSYLLEALVSRWPSAVLTEVPVLATDEEKARVIQQLMTHKAFRAAHLKTSRATLLQLAQELKDPAWRGRALQSQMKDVPKGHRLQLALEILSAAQLSGDAAFLQEAELQVADCEYGRELEKCLADLRASQEPSRRALLSRLLLSRAPPELRGELARELLAAARQLRLGERAVALGDSTRQLPEELVPEALELLRDEPGSDSWFRAHEGLVPHLSDQQLDQLLREANGVHPDVLLAMCQPELQAVCRELHIDLRRAEPGCLRAMMLFALLARHPGPNRERLIDRILAVVEELRGRQLQASVLARLAQQLRALPERIERMATELLADPSTHPTIAGAMGSLLTRSMLLALLEASASAAPVVREETFEALARTLSEERRREAVQLLQSASPAVRASGLLALAPGLAAASDAELLRPTWHDLQQTHGEDEIHKLFSLMIRSAPGSQVPGLFERAGREAFARKPWFVRLVVAWSQWVPELIGQAIQAVGGLKDPWEHFATLAVQILKLPPDERLRSMRTLLREAQRAEQSGAWRFIEIIKTAALSVDRTLQDKRIVDALSALRLLDAETLQIAARFQSDMALPILRSSEGEYLFQERARDAVALLTVEKFERSLPPGEPVLLGTSVPAKVSPGDEFTARFVACVERLQREVAAKLELLGPGANTVIGFQRCQWQLGGKFRVRVTSPHLLVSAEEQEFVWNADVSVLDFGVRVPPKARGRRTSLQFEVFFEGARVALLRHDLSVALLRRAAGKRRVQLSRAPRTAFASFSADDRNRVLDRIASLRLAAGLDVFMDCLSLRPGEEWKQALLTEIKQRELFLLFWSRNAQASKWVEWEWRTALRVKKREAIQPHPLEPVAVAPPPKELAMLHFGDVYMLVREE